MLVSEIEMKQSKMDECQKYAEQYSTTVKVRRFSYFHQIYYLDMWFDNILRKKEVFASHLTLWNSENRESSWESCDTYLLILCDMWVTRQPLLHSSSLCHRHAQPHTHTRQKRCVALKLVSYHLSLSFSFSIARVVPGRTWLS